MTIRRCGDNGVQIWTSVAGRYEGSRIRNNRIEDIANLSGGDGPYGNGVAIWGAGFVRVETNQISRCAYTAVRNNAGHDVEVIGNDCKGCGERAMYAEFGAKRATFRNNKIDDAGAGIALANAERGTDIGLVTGNVITGLHETHPDDEFGPQMSWLTGIEAESNVVVAGNTIIGGWMGVRCGGYRQNIRVEDNHLIDNEYGVTFQIGEGVGRAVIARNEISRRAQGRDRRHRRPRDRAGRCVAAGDRGEISGRRHRGWRARENLNAASIILRHHRGRRRLSRASSDRNRP